MRTREALEQKLLAAQAAYDAGTPTLTDEEFDMEVEALRIISPKSRVLAHLGAPVSSSKVVHAAPALSLNKIKLDQLTRWCEQRMEGAPFIIQPKYDGVSLILQYGANGKIATAATRGDGMQGDDVLENAVLVPTVPRDVRRGPLWVRGELMLPLHAFDEVKDEYANPRNLVAGLLMRKSGDRSLLRKCTFIAYECSVKDFAAANLALLASEGFRSSAYWIAEKGNVNVQLESVIGRVGKPALDSMTTDLSEFELDGFVVKVVNPDVAAKLGATAHHPNSACAIKLADNARETELIGVEWQVSRTGVIAPVGHVKPVVLAGATVTRVTMHNLDVIATLSVCVGDTISMTRRGAVIPQIECVVQQGSVRSPIHAPNFCPSCASDTIRVGAFVKCSEPATCRDVQVHTLLHWATVTGMLGFGYETMRKLWDAKIVRTPVDFYRMRDDEDRMLDMRESLGAKITLKLCKQIDMTTVLAPATFIQALGIDHLGRSASAQMVEALGSVEELMAWARRPVHDQPILVAGIGNVTAAAFARGLRENEDLIEALLEYIELETEAQIDLSTHTGAFAGKNIVFTGPLASMSREEAQAAVRKLGAKTPDGLTKSTDLLVVGGEARDAQSGKRDKAAKYNAKGANIEVITEDEFIVRLAKETA